MFNCCFLIWLVLDFRAVGPSQAPWDCTGACVRERNCLREGKERGERCWRRFSLLSECVTLPCSHVSKRWTRSHCREKHMDSSSHKSARRPLAVVFLRYRETCKKRLLKNRLCWLLEDFNRRVIVSQCCRLLKIRKWEKNIVAEKTVLSADWLFVIKAIVSVVWRSCFFEGGGRKINK